MTDFQIFLQRILWLSKVAINKINKCSAHDKFHKQSKSKRSKELFPLSVFIDTILRTTPSIKSGDVFLVRYVLLAQVLSTVVIYLSTWYVYKGTTAVLEAKKRRATTPKMVCQRSEVYGFCERSSQVMQLYWKLRSILARELQVMPMNHGWWQWRMIPFMWILYMYGWVSL